ncbi:MAG: nickel pincer cofactor biosynthesis protein LarB [bacterium]|nr:nickel pincer cofactor biosynthesis protein LarB [bacterium]
MKVDKKSTEKICGFQYHELGFAKVDTHRSLRMGTDEVIFCIGKTLSQIVKIAQVILESNNRLIATKANREVFKAIKSRWSKAVFHEKASIITVNKFPKKKTNKNILILTAGTADIPVAEEASVTAEFLGNNVKKIYDVGVAGIHRLFKNLGEIQSANVIIVVAGMEGALASVVGGITPKPVIGVPTSVGYGASFSGITPLLTMLNSCAEGVVVVNIDNGFGAGYFASLINK